MQELANIIEAGFERRNELGDRSREAPLVHAVEQAIELLDSGAARVAEKRGADWHVNQWLKKAVLLSFRLSDNRVFEGATSNFYDKVPLKFTGYDAAQFAQAGVRVVPNALVRRGAFIAPNVVLMPCYVNIGANIGSGTMVDTWATVGNCPDRQERAFVGRCWNWRRAGARAGRPDHHRR